MGVISTHPAILLLIISLGQSRGNIDVRFIAPSAAFEGERFVSFFREYQTTEDRRSYLQAAREQGYTCSMLEHNYQEAVGLFCAKTPTTTYTDVPKSAKGLRATLANVSLRAWLPSLLCPTRMTDELSVDNNDYDDTIDHKACCEAVEEALATQLFAEATLVYDGEKNVMRATVDEVPWLKVLQNFVGPRVASNFHPLDCSMASIALASEHAKIQLLPALRTLAGQNQPLSSTATIANVALDGAGGKNSVSSRSIAIMKQFSSSPVPDEEIESPTTNDSIFATNRQALSSVSSSAMPSAGRIESLLALLGGGHERSGMGITPPFLHMKHPMPQGRVSGGVVKFAVEVFLGAALRTSLLAAATTNDGSSSSGSGYRRVGGDKGMEPPLSDYDRCVIRAVVDGSTSSTIPIDTADVFNNDGETAVVMQTAIIPTYDQNPRCSEHPAKASAGWSAWAQNEDVWRVDARAVDRVCTREAFGAHHIHGELACRRYQHGYGKPNQLRTEPIVQGNANEGERGSSAPSPRLESNMEAPAWEVLATSAMVEYFHTGHLADILSSSPWVAPSGGESRDNKGKHKSDGSKVSNPLFDSPPEEISVTLYLESDPDETFVVVAVPRWLSDGEVWEAAFGTCSKAFGPFQGYLVNVNDCVDLVTSAITAKRVDLFNIMSQPLIAYLRSVCPSYNFEGHTGGFLQKVEALGALWRDGGDRVKKICEVNEEPSFLMRFDLGDLIFGIKVGFNAGHSSLNWLLHSHPSTKILAFDLGEHQYMKHALDYMQVLIGDSSVTIPAYVVAEDAAGREPQACNILFVDGDHSEGGAYADLVNFRVLASR
ncbi:unnamed protein product [Ectocarpus sp. CCAP 1310/34]|nr:unnamed protein product [Ectocarpus sp. CCAP 1310/34]